MFSSYSANERTARQQRSTNLARVIQRLYFTNQTIETGLFRPQPPPGWWRRCSHSNYYPCCLEVIGPPITSPPELAAAQALLASEVATRNGHHRRQTRALSNAKTGWAEIETLMSSLSPPGGLSSSCFAFVIMNRIPSHIRKSD